MDQTPQKKEQTDEAQSSQDEEVEPSETLHNLKISTNPKEECRLILLGGDELAKSEACRFIFRTAQVQMANLGSCEMKENYIQQRHVCVVKSPFFWMDRLESSKIFSRTLKRIKNQMQNCVSLVFPGPHAFLLVIGAATGKEHYLLKAISSVFGKEAIDYSMVVFIARSDINSRRSQESLLMCKDRYHLLENTDDSVQELFRKVEEMLSNKKSKFFIPSEYETFTEVNFESWEKKRIDLLDHHKDKGDRLSQEVEDLKIRNLKLEKETENVKMELDVVTQREGELRIKLNTSQQRESDLLEKLEASLQTVSKLRMDLDASRQREREQIIESQQRESELWKELNASQRRESELWKEVNASRQRESELRSRFESTQQERQTTGTQLERRGSKEQVHTNFSSGKNEYLE